MRCFGRKTGETTIAHKQEVSLSLFPYLVEINYLPYRTTTYFVMAENEKEAFNKTKSNLLHSIEYFKKEQHIGTVNILKSIIDAIEGNTKVTLIDSNRIHRVIEFDAPNF